MLRERSKKSEKFADFSKSSNKIDQNLGKSGLKSVSSLDQNVASNATNSGMQLSVTAFGKNSENLSGKADHLADFLNVFAAKKPKLDSIDSPI